MGSVIAFKPGVDLPLWASFFLMPKSHSIDLSPVPDYEKWVLLSTPTRKYVSLLLALGQLIEILKAPESQHHNYGVDEISKIEAGELITWLSVDKKELHFGQMIDPNYDNGNSIRYEFLSAKKSKPKTTRDKDSACKFRFDRYLGQEAKDSRPLSERALGAEKLFGLSNLDLQCHSAAYVHVVGKISELTDDSLLEIYVDEQKELLQAILRPDKVFSTGHYLSRWSSVDEVDIEDDGFELGSDLTIFDGPSAYFRNRDVSSKVNIVVLDRWENRASGVVEDFLTQAAMYGGLTNFSSKGLAVDIGMFMRPV